jgi:hypothetical protein
MLRVCEQAWRRHTADLRTTRAAVNDRHEAEAAVLLRLALRGWRNHTSHRQQHRAYVLERCIDKQVAGLQTLAFSAWRQYTQVWVHAGLSAAKIALRSQG